MANNLVCTGGKCAVEEEVRSQGAQKEKGSQASGGVCGCLFSDCAPPAWAALRHAARLQSPWGDVHVEMLRSL